MNAYPRGGKGIDMHCHDVGLRDPSAVAGDALKGLNNQDTGCKGHDEQPRSYNQWIEQMQKDRNADWEMNVQFEGSPDTPKPPTYDKFTLFNEGVEKYAMEQTSICSKNLQNVAKLTQAKNMFAPCMVGSLESQFLKMQCMIKGAGRVLDIGTFTGMSAIAMAEGIPADGKVITLESYEDIAKAAQEAFDQSDVGKKIELRVAPGTEEMTKLKNEGMQFDLIFIDADKENYAEYYNLAMDGLLADDGIILADNSLCALLYDGSDMRSQKLHEFNQMVKNDKRVEQVMLTLREGVTMIRKIA